MKKNYWQPNIDNWILNENDANSYDVNINSRFGGNILGSKSGHPHSALPLKNEEEEAHDKLEQPYKGIMTLSKLREQINKVLENAYGLSKVDKEHKNLGNPYEAIVQILDNPDLKAMLDIASNELKKKNLSSF